MGDVSLEERVKALEDAGSSFDALIWNLKAAVEAIEETLAKNKEIRDKLIAWCDHMQIEILKLKQDFAAEDEKAWEELMFSET